MEPKEKTHSERRFQFNSYNTIPHWYDVASFMFDYVRPDVTDRAEQWICDKWGRTDRDCYDDMRKPITEKDRQRRSNRQGAIPEIESLQTYLEYHAMFCAVGEMLGRFPIDGDTSLDWQSWLGSHLNSSNDYWISDLRSPTPHHLDCWGEFSSIDIDEWLDRIQPVEFDSGLGLTEKSHLGEIVVLGDIDIWDFQRNSSLNVTSALVNPIRARALLHSLQTTDPNDFLLPVIGRGTGEFEIEESGFELTAWMREGWDRDDTLDKFDPLSRNREFNLTNFQPHFIDTMKLQPNSNRTKYSISNGETVARLELWSDSLNQEYISHPFSSGGRWWIRIDLLLEYLRQCDRDLIIEVNIGHNRNQRNQGETGEHYEYGDRKSKIYLLRQNGILETLDSHSDIRTTAS